ncbi:hypothetical protein DFR46_1626 [Parasphingopyxis lamellibrachiae]|uniref:Uncharacterized protein n=1 Tax=Parasphingopyxis lamellibrachiae TaxID=680125 RepID=A0A3D9FFK2_9SPHN|nr:hypothetical protein DFR46_1626 [Parasphingopyxis lamellibrachiae]
MDGLLRAPAHPDRAGDRIWRRGARWWTSPTARATPNAPGCPAMAKRRAPLTTLLAAARQRAWRAAEEGKDLLDQSGHEQELRVMRDREERK